MERTNGLASKWLCCDGEQVERVFCFRPTPAPAVLSSGPAEIPTHPQQQLPTFVGGWLLKRFNTRLAATDTHATASRSPVPTDFNTTRDEAEKMRHTTRPAPNGKYQKEAIGIEL